MTRHFTISETSKLTGMSVHTLRYYERMGLVEIIARNPSGVRGYTRKDVEWIIFIGLFRRMGMSIQETLEFARLKRGGISTAPQRKIFLERYRDQLVDQIKERERIIELVDLKLHVLANKITANNQD